MQRRLVVCGVKGARPDESETYFGSFGIVMVDLTDHSDDSEERGGGPDA
jgi:hypothetical protein